MSHKNKVIPFFKWGIIFTVLLCGIALILFPFFMPRPLVSVVMPVYNRAEFLPRAIESILNQSLTDFEFIIVDDGSTDDSWQVIQSYAKRDRRIIPLRHQMNKGVSAARNFGTDRARGTYIAVMDSDDAAYPDRLQKSVSFLNTHPEITAVTGRYVTNKHSNPNVWVPPKRLAILMYFSNYFTHPSVIRHSFLKQHQIRYDERLTGAEDYDLWSRIIMAGGQLYILNDTLMYLRRHHTYPQEHYTRMRQNKKNISARLLKRFGISKQSAVGLSRCDLMALMIPKNKQLNLVDQDALMFIHTKECTKKQRPAGSLYIKANDWLDYFYPKKDGFYTRETTNDLWRIDFVGDTAALLTDTQGNTLFFERENSVYNQITQEKFQQLINK